MPPIPETIRESCQSAGKVVPSSIIVAASSSGGWTMTRISVSHRQTSSLSSHTCCSIQIPLDLFWRCMVPSFPAFVARNLDRYGWLRRSYRPIQWEVMSRRYLIGASGQRTMNALPVISRHTHFRHPLARPRGRG